MTTRLQQDFSEASGTVVFHHVRHAKPICEPNYIYGAVVDIDLSNKKALSQTAKQLPRENASWVASPFQRAIDTALSLQASKPLSNLTSLRIVEDLREQSWGIWEGRYMHDLRNDVVFKAYFANPDRVTPPDGESSATLMRRVSKTLDALAVEAVSAQKANVVSVSHGGVIRAALAYADGLDFQDGLAKYKHVDPLSVTQIEATVEDGAVAGWAVKSVNWTAPALG